MSLYPSGRTVVRPLTRVKNSLADFFKIYHLCTIPTCPKSTFLRRNSIFDSILKSRCVARPGTVRPEKVGLLAGHGEK